jgi:hypothetical protein
MPGPIKIYVDPVKIAQGDFDKMLMDKYDAFYRRIVDYVLIDLEQGYTDGFIATIVDTEGFEYDMHLPRDGYGKSLNKAMQYFTKIEEYETCSLIKDILKQIEE